MISCSNFFLRNNSKIKFRRNNSAEKVFPSPITRVVQWRSGNGSELNSVRIGGKILVDSDNAGFGVSSREIKIVFPTNCSQFSPVLIAII